MNMICKIHQLYSNNTYISLGFVAFGGPQAHVAILRDHLVVQRNWLDEEQFTELFAIGQGLPGKSAFVLFYNVNSSVQYDVLVI